MYVLKGDRLGFLDVQYVYARCSPTFGHAKSRVSSRSVGEEVLETAVHC